VQVSNKLYSVYNFYKIITNAIFSYFVTFSILTITLIIVCFKFAVLFKLCRNKMLFNDFHCDTLPIYITCCNCSIGFVQNIEINFAALYQRIDHFRVSSVNDT